MARSLPLIGFLAAATACSIAPAWASDLPRELIAHCVGCDLSGADLHGRDLSGVEFVGANLSRANLRGADLHGAKFTGADLRGTNFDRANLTNAAFTGVDFSDTSFAGARMVGVKFVGIKLDQATADRLIGAHGMESCTGCDLRGVSLRSHDLTGVRLVGVDMRDVDLANAVFVRAQLVGADMRRATATGANFAGAELIGADLKAAVLGGASFHNAVVCAPEHNDDAERTAGYSGVTCIDLTGANLRDTDFRGARFCRRDATDCRPVTGDELRTVAHADLSAARYDH